MNVWSLQKLLGSADRWACTHELNGQRVDLIEEAPVGRIEQIRQQLDVDADQCPVNIFGGALEVVDPAQRAEQIRAAVGVAAEPGNHLVDERCL